MPFPARKVRHLKTDLPQIIACNPTPDIFEWWLARLPTPTGVHKIGHWCNISGYLSAKTPHLGKNQGEVYTIIA